MVADVNMDTGDRQLTLSGGLKGFLFFAGFGFLASAPLALHPYDGNGLAVAFAALGVLCVLQAMVQRFGGISIETLFFLISFVYVYAAFFDYTIFQNTKGFDIDYIVWITLLGLSTLLAFSMGVLLRRNDPASQIADDDPPREDHVLLPCLVFTYLALGAYFFFARSYFNVGVVLSRGELYQSVPLVLELVKLALPILIIVGFIAMTKRPAKTSIIIKAMFVFALVLFVFVETIVFGDRRISISLIFCLLILRNTVKRISSAWLLLLPPAALGSVIGGYFRNQSSDIYAKIIENISAIRALNPINTEFGAFHVVARTFFREPFSAQMSMSVFEVPLALVPGFLLPNRPTAPSVSFVQEYFPEIYAIGGGLAYNIVIEFYQNFWYFGPLILGVCLSFVVARLTANPRSYLTYLFLWNLFFVMRMDMVTLSRNTLIAFAVFGIVKLTSTLLVTRKD